MSTNQVNVEEKVEQAKSSAIKYVREGWGSRASVFRAIYDVFDTDLTQEMCDKICSILDPFHAPASAIYKKGKAYGITACGALSGALAAFSMVHGWRKIPYKFWVDGMKPDGFLGKVIDDPAVSSEEKVRIYNDRCEQLGYGAYYQIVERFRKHFGTTDCFEFEKPYGNPVSRECFKNCARVITWTAGMVAQVILEYERDTASLKIGNGNVHLAVIRSVEQDSSE
jgi:hypothetical protein